MTAPLPALVKPHTHPQVAIASLTFCCGLFLVRAVLSLGLFKGFKVPPFSIHDPLVQLQGIAFGITLLYFALRKDEGDFRALYIGTLVLFMGSEALNYIYSGLGVVSLNQLSILVSFAVAIYSSLTLSAAAYDYAESRSGPDRRSYVLVCCAILALSLFRALGTVFFAGPGNESIRTNVMQKVDVAGLIVLATIVAHLLVYLSNLLGKPSTTPDDSDSSI